MEFDVAKVPFSRYGSYFGFSVLDAEHAEVPGLYLRTVHGEADREVFRISALVDGREAPFRCAARPDRLEIRCPEGSAEFCIPAPDTVAVRTAGIGLRLSKPGVGDYDYVLRDGDGSLRLNLSTHRMTLVLSATRGTLAVDAPWDGLHSERIAVDLVPEEDGTAGVVLRETASGLPATSGPVDFDRAAEEALRDFEAWRGRMPAVPEGYAAARDLAAYVGWASTVAPAGFLRRPAMLMSKNFMTNVWSWDHCFNAMALAGDPARALDQMSVPFDFQDAAGALPDMVNDRMAVWNFVKPPVHGWALAWLRANSRGMTAEDLRPLYGPVARWTDWWFRRSDRDGDGLPEYDHGNDSGWDNGTAFAGGGAVEAPDLCAFLVLQMDFLAGLADDLGLAADAAAWRVRADDLLAALMRELWDGTSFFAREGGSHRRIACDSLQTLLPVALGPRLPPEVFGRVVDAIFAEGRFLTPHGLSTESAGSPRYRADGYWRGPIWAPPTLLVVDGLWRGGERAKAADLARRFCDLCARGGFAENFDAATGEGLRDRAYTWTASAFLVLASGYLDPSRDAGSDARPALVREDV